MKDHAAAIALLSIAVGFFSSCDFSLIGGGEAWQETDDGDGSDAPGDEARLLISGHYSYGGVRVGRLWIDGEWADFSTPESGSEARSVFVAGGDVYAIGAYADKGCYWKNGQRFDLGSGGSPQSLFVVDDDIYIAGYYVGGSSAHPIAVACYWLNGVRIDLGDGLVESKAYSVFVSGDRVYICGYCQHLLLDICKACLWVNGELAFLDEGMESSAGTSVVVSGDDVYVAGSYGMNDTYVACIWENGIIIPLDTNTSKAVTIAVEGDDVYAAGFCYRDLDGQLVKNACLWMNSNKEYLSECYSSATSTFVEGANVYVSGYRSDGIKPIACYWKNGIPIDLDSPGRSTQPEAVSIFVSEGKIYAAANYYLGESRIPCCWIDGHTIDTDPVNKQIVYDTKVSVCVEEGDVYMAGTYRDPASGSIACYWKNGILHEIKEKVRSEPSSICVDGDDAYMAGHWFSEEKDSTIACYWVNGDRIDLDGAGSMAYSLAFMGADLYVVGSCDGGGMKGSAPCLWKNGERTLMGEAGAATSVFIYDGDVYIAGSNWSVACYWKNGVRVDVNPYAYSIANSIFVTERDILVSGYEYEAAHQELHSAFTWRNGIKTAVDSSFPFSEASAAVVMNDDVYVIGYYNDDYIEHPYDFRACYWKNGTRFDLSPFMSRAYGAFVARN